MEARAIRQRASTGNMVMTEGDEAAKGGGGVFAIVRHDTDGSALDLSQGGRVLVSARAPQVKEGAWPGERLSVIEFGDRAAAAAWREAVDARPSGTEAVLVEGA